MELIWVNYIVIYLDDFKIVLVVMVMGLFKIMDGGLGWDYVFVGCNN